VAAVFGNPFTPAPTGSGMVENVLYPAYFDAGYTRGEGRRVPQALAVAEPTVDELAKAVQQVGYDAVIERDVTYTREFEPRGRVLVENADDATKSDLLGAVAAYLAALRE
jgi:signal recognition particle subunit SRP19